MKRVDKLTISMSAWKDKDGGLKGFSLCQLVDIHVRAWQAYNDIARQAFGYGGHGWGVYSGRSSDHRTLFFHFTRIPTRAEFKAAVSLFYTLSVGIRMPNGVALNTSMLMRDLKVVWDSLRRRTRAQAIAAGPKSLIKRIEAGLKPQYANAEIRALIEALGDDGPYLELAQVLERDLNSWVLNAPRNATGL